MSDQQEDPQLHEIYQQVLKLMDKDGPATPTKTGAPATPAKAGGGSGSPDVKGSESPVKNGDDQRLVKSPSQKYYKTEDPDFSPTRKAEIALVNNLSEIKEKKSYAARHIPDLQFDLKSEPRFFKEDGSVNVNAVLSKGLTEIVLIKKETELYSEVTKEIRGVEDEWGLSAELKSEEMNKIDHQKSSFNRSIEHRNDVPRENESIHKALLDYSVDDDRQARLQRLQKFEEIAPKLANYNNALSIEPILLDGDTVVSSFRCTELKGIPSSWYGMKPGKWLSFTTVDEKGLIQISLIQNKDKKYRFHISICNAQTKFSADEVFYDKIDTNAVTCCFCPTVQSKDVQSMVISYDQVATFESRDLLIPLYDKGFQNCVTYRKQSQRTIVRADGQSLQERNGIFDFNKVINNSCCLCIFSYLENWGFTKNRASKSHDSPCLTSTTMCFNETAYCCFTCSYNAFIAVPSGKFPCAPASRLMYFCCAARCFADCCHTICGIDNASVVSERKIKYTAEETYNLGDDNSIKKVFSKLPVEPKQKATNTGEWHPFPWYSCGCCFMEYRGEDFDCLYCLGLSKKRNKEVFEDYNWDYVTPKKENFNELFVELNFHDALQRSRISMAQASTSIHRIAKPLPSSFLSANKLVLKLATNFDDIDAVHEKARKFISFIGNNCNELYQEMDEAIKLEQYRQEAVSKTIENTDYKSYGLRTSVSD